MMQTMTRGNESSAATGYLLVAFELSQRWWKVGFTTGMGHRVRTRRIAAGALESVAEAIADAQKVCGLAADARVISCFSRSRSGCVLAAPVSDGARRHQLRGGFGEHRSRSAGPADEVKCTGFIGERLA